MVRGRPRPHSLETQGLKDAGLWSLNYTDVPEGDELTQACNELFGFDSGQSVVRAGVAAALSKLTQARDATDEADPDGID